MIDVLTAKGARVDLHHGMQAATTEQEGSEDRKAIAKLLNSRISKRSHPSRVTEVE